MSDFEILEKNEKVSYEDMLYGFEKYTITKEDIEALLKGQKLYGTINAEYAFTIELGEKENINNNAEDIEDLDARITRAEEQYDKQKEEMILGDKE